MHAAQKNLAKTFNDDFCLVYPVEKLDKLIVIKTLLLMFVICNCEKKSEIIECKTVCIPDKEVC